MNDHEAQRIAAAMHELRPDWPASSLLTLIRKNLIDKPRRDVTVALAWVACESGTHTPARVLEAGPWWRAAGVEGAPTLRQPFEPNAFCSTCGKTEAACRNNPYAEHEFLSVEAYRVQLARTDIQTEAGAHARAQGLREAALDETSVREKPTPGTEGTQRVEALRAAVTAVGAAEEEA